MPHAGFVLVVFLWVCVCVCQSAWERVCVVEAVETWLWNWNTTIRPGDWCEPTWRGEKKNMKCSAEDKYCHEGLFKGRHCACMCAHWAFASPPKKNQAKVPGGISAPATVIRPSLAPSWRMAALSRKEWQKQLPFKPWGETACVGATGAAKVGQSALYFLFQQLHKDGKNVRQGKRKAEEIQQLEYWCISFLTVHLAQSSVGRHSKLY